MEPCALVPSLKAAVQQFNFGGGVLQAVAKFTTNLPMTLTGNGGPATVDGDGWDVTLAGNLSGTGGLTLTGGSTVHLSGNNTYLGTTTIDDATLAPAGTAASARI